MTTSTPGVEAVLAVFAAVEQRDDEALARACQPDVEFCWPPSLPYGGTARCLSGRGEGWAAYWDWLHPTAAQPRLGPRLAAAARPHPAPLGAGPRPPPARPLHPTAAHAL